MKKQQGLVFAETINGDEVNVVCRLLVFNTQHLLFITLSLYKS